MNKLDDIEKMLHERYLATLNLFRFVKSAAFKQAFDLADNAQRLVVQKYAETLSQESINSWVKKILTQHNQFENLDVRCLRDIAAKNGVKCYNLKSKLELISELRSLINAKSTSRTSLGNEAVIGEVRQNI